MKLIQVTLSHLQKGQPIFPYGCLNSNNVKIQVGGWVWRKGLFELKGAKILAPKKSLFLWGKNN